MIVLLSNIDEHARKKSWMSNFIKFVIGGSSRLVPIISTFFGTHLDRSQVLFSDWSISKMNITNLALDQSERSTESERSVILIFDLRLRGGRTRFF